MLPRRKDASGALSKQLGPDAHRVYSRKAGRTGPAECGCAHAEMAQGSAPSPQRAPETLHGPAYQKRPCNQWVAGAVRDMCTLVVTYFPEAWPTRGLLWVQALLSAPRTLGKDAKALTGPAAGCPGPCSTHGPAGAQELRHPEEGGPARARCAPTSQVLGLGCVCLTWRLSTRSSLSHPLSRTTEVTLRTQAG